MEQSKKDVNDHAGAESELNGGLARRKVENMKCGSLNLRRAAGLRLGLETLGELWYARARSNTRAKVQHSAHLIAQRRHTTSVIFRGQG